VQRAAQAAYQEASREQKDGVVRMHPLEYTTQGKRGPKYRPRVGISAPARLKNALERGLMAARI